MQNLILQPAVGHPAPSNVGKSLAKPVDLEALPLTPAERSGLRLAAGGQPIFAWGCTHDRVWKRMQPGDQALFMTESGWIRFRGLVVATHESTSVAGAIWGSQSSDYRYVYFLVGVRRCDLSRRSINEALQDTSSPTEDNWQQVRYIDDVDGVRRVLSLIGRQDLPNEAARGIEFATGLDEEDAEDGVRLAAYRKEHEDLKRLLFGNRLSMNCAVCGREFPRQFLITAHLKRRSVCSRKERVDPAVVLPMCTFGCDALYERGYLSMDSSTNLIVATEKTSLLQGAEVASAVAGLIGRRSPYPLGPRKPYLDWHNSYFGAAPLHQA